MEKHCKRHGPERHPYCVECLRDDHAENAAKYPDKDQWGDLFIKPLAQAMMEKGISHLAISIANGKAIFVLEPDSSPSKLWHRRTTSLKIMKPTQDPEAAETVQTKEIQAVDPAATCSDCEQEWYDGADSECIKGSKCGFRKRGVSIAEVARNVSDVQRRIMDNAEIQDALKRLEFVIGAEMGSVKYISANVDFEDGGTALIWIDPNDQRRHQCPAETSTDIQDHE